MEVSSHFIYEKYESYTPGYDSRGLQIFHYKEKKTAEDFVLNINKKQLIVPNFEAMDKKVFSNKLKGYLNNLQLNEEGYLLTHIKILSELRNCKSKHFDNKEYEELIVQFSSLVE